MPDDILIQTFKFVLLDYERDATFITIFRYARSRVKSIAVLLTLSHVCKRWKTVIWAYPCFWTRADGHHKELLHEVLTCTRDLPLSLFVTSETKGLLELLVSYSTRIKRLDITISDGVSGFGDLTFISGKSLECFTLNYEDFGAGLQRTFPFFLFGEEVLPLQALSISPFTGHFPMNHFPNLTHLRLVLRVAWNGDEIPQPLSSSFFDLLSNTPMLEFLTVSGIGDPVEGFSDALALSNTPVVLGCIRSIIFMAGGLRTIGMVLSRLSIAPTALIRLQGVQASSPAVPPLPHLSVVESVDRLHLATEHACLQLIAEGPSSGLWVQGLVAHNDEAGEEDEDTRSWCQWLLMLPEFMPLARITKLELYLGPHHTFLSTLLPHMIGVVELSIRLNHEDERCGGKPNLSLARLLYQALAEADPLLCANLRVLSIDVDGYRPIAIPDLYPEEMRRMIILRARAGHPVDRIVIQPFADLHTVQGGLYDNVASRFDTLRMVVKNLEVRGPGICAIPCNNDIIWDRWSVKGGDKYWEMEWYEEVMYTSPWGY